MEVARQHSPSGLKGGTDKQRHNSYSKSLIFIYIVTKANKKNFYLTELTSPSSARERTYTSVNVLMTSKVEFLVYVVKLKSSTQQ